MKSLTWFIVAIICYVFFAVFLFKYISMNSVNASATVTYPFGDVGVKAFLNEDKSKIVIVTCLQRRGEPTTKCSSKEYEAK